MANFLRPALMTVLLTFAGCDDEATSSSGAPSVLQSITQQDTDGNTTAFTRFDYENGKLVRIRYYDDAGDDGKFGTADDVMSKWIACSVEVIGNPLLEFQVSAFPLGIPESCEHNGLQASRIESIYFNNPGADGLWLTSDDVSSGAAVITRTASGSHYTYNEANCDDCRKTESHSEYLLDDSNRLIGIRKEENSLTVYHYSSKNRLETESQIAIGTDSGFGFINGQQMTYLHKKNKIEIELEYLIQDYESISNSPTSQILLAVFGLSAHPDGFLTINGTEYGRFKIMGYYYRITHLPGGFIKIETRHGEIITLLYGQP